MTPSEWREVTAVFGGRFDPPHLGHREAVEGLLKNPGVLRVLVIPSASPPHKPCSASLNQRLEMTRLNFTDIRLGEVQINTSEIERAAREPNRPSYSFETLIELSRDIPKLAFVIGADQLALIHTWYRFPELLGISNWIVLERKPKGEGIARATLAQWESNGLARAEGDRSWRLTHGKSLLLVSTPARAVSSSEIRETIARTGKASQNGLLPNVDAYLKTHRVYGINKIKEC